MPERHAEICSPDAHWKRYVGMQSGEACCKKKWDFVTGCTWSVAEWLDGGCDKIGRGVRSRKRQRLRRAEVSRQRTRQGYHTCGCTGAAKRWLTCSVSSSTTSDGQDAHTLSRSRSCATAHMMLHSSCGSDSNCLRLSMHC
jgi:hypothetical protein